MIRVSEKSIEVRVFDNRERERERIKLQQGS